MRHDVFLSYRRSDSAGHAGRVCDDLERHFGASVVFRDIQSIDAGADFVDALERALDEARVVIVLIGDEWLDTRGEDGRRRLDDPDDYVRREVAAALQDQTVNVLPVLVGGARMPDEDDLPEPLRGLSRLQALELSESRWAFDMGRLAQVLEDAGVRREQPARMPRWVVPLVALLVVAVVALAWCCWRDPGATLDRYTGLWHLPNGGFWTVRDRPDGTLQIDETHHESRQVWRRGSATIEQRQLTATLEYTFDSVPYRLLYRLRLSDDGQSLIGTMRRSDRESDSSLVLTRDQR